MPLPSTTKPAPPYLATWSGAAGNERPTLLFLLPTHRRTWKPVGTPPHVASGTRRLTPSSLATTCFACSCSLLRVRVRVCRVRMRACSPVRPAVVTVPPRRGGGRRRGRGSLGGALGRNVYAKARETLLLWSGPKKNDRHSLGDFGRAALRFDNCLTGGAPVALRSLEKRWESDHVRILHLSCKMREWTWMPGYTMLDPNMHALSNCA